MRMGGKSQSGRRGGPALRLKTRPHRQSSNEKGGKRVQLAHPSLRVKG